MNEIGIAVLAVVALFAAFQLGIFLQAKRARGKSLQELDAPAAAVLGDCRDALVYFHSPNCMPCRGMTPAVDEVAADHPGRVFKVDVTENPAAAVAFRVRATPTLVRIKDGRVDDVFLGAKGKSQVVALLP